MLRVYRVCLLNLILLFNFNVHAQSDSLIAKMDNLNRLAVIYPDSGLEALRTNLQEVKTPSIYVLARTNYSLGIGNQRNGDLDSAKYYYKQSNKIITGKDFKGIDELDWRIQKGLFEVYTKKGEFDSANYYLRVQEKNPLITKENTEKKAGLIYAKCFLASKEAKHEECTSYGFEVLKIQPDTSDNTAMHVNNTLMLVANEFVLLKDPSNAKKYFEIAISNNEKFPLADRFTGPLFHNYARFLLENVSHADLAGKDSLEQAGLYRKAKEVISSLLERKTLTRFQTALYSNSLAESYFYLKDYQNGIKYHTIAHDFFAERNKLYGGVILLNRALCFLKVGKMKKAENDATIGLQAVKAENNGFYTRFGYRVMSEVKEGKNDYKEALSFYKQHILIRDSIEREDELVKISDLESKFELGQREKDLAFKEKELALSEEVSESKSKTIWAFGGGLVAVLLLSIFLFRSNREKKMINGFLVEKQNIIEENLKEKEALLREVHHRVKNNLQVVSGMLQLQADKVDDPKVDAIMQEGQERIKSMAIIHQRFYEGEELRDISFGEYLVELTEEIASSYGSKQLIQLNIKDNKERFNIDTSIPLGIIVNELISNAYKHAFTIKGQGEIVIQLIKESTGTSSLVVKDNGVGLPDNFNIEETQSMGLKLVRILIKQMRGNLEYLNDGGAQFIISFPSNQ